MVEKKLFKTKLCVLYERGNCSRQSCSFAHGDAELRGFSSSASASASFNGRRDYRGSDLRDKLERRRSPQRRYSPGRDVRGRHTLHARKQLQHDRGYSSSRSPSRRRRRKQNVNGPNDISGSLKVSDGGDGFEERQVSTSCPADELEEKLKQVQLDVDMLDHHKSELETHLEKKVQEADFLFSRIQELETQLNKEQEDCKRINSTINKFIKVHSRYTKAQVELKRSQARLQKMGDQLAISASRTYFHDEDSSLNILSDGEPNDDNATSPRNVREFHPPSRKRHRHSHEAAEDGMTENLRKYPVGASLPEKLSKVDALAGQSDYNHKDAESQNRIRTEGNGLRSLAYKETNNKRRKDGSLSIDPMEKGKGLETGNALPPTCMAAQAADESIEMERVDVVGAAATVYEKSTSREKGTLEYLPPPPPLPAVSKSAYKQYEGEEMHVDVDQLDVDINSEVDIEL